MVTVDRSGSCNKNTASACEIGGGAGFLGVARFTSPSVDIAWSIEVFAIHSI